MIRLRVLANEFGGAWRGLASQPAFSALGVSLASGLGGVPHVAGMMLACALAIVATGASLIELCEPGA